MLKFNKNQSSARSYGRHRGLSVLLIIFLFCAVCLGFCAFLNDKSEVRNTAHADACPYHTTQLTAGGTLNSGTYYLAGDLTLTSPITVNGTVNICLNGYVLKSSVSGKVITINSGRTLNLYDCGNDDNHKHYYTKNSNHIYVLGSGTDYLTGGVISCNETGGANVVQNAGGTFNMYGGNLIAAQGAAVYNSGGTFNMYDGKICGNMGTNCGGVYVSNRQYFNMYGGEVSDNCCSGTVNCAGGVYCFGSVTISGNVKIYDNTKASGSTVCDVYTRTPITIGSEGLKDGAYIGITTGAYQNYNAGAFIGTNNSSQATSDLLNNYFFNDANAHIHNYGTLVPRQEAADCSHTGLEAHYQCSACNLYFDANKKQVSYDSLIIPAKPHTEVTDPAVAATCTSEGKTAGSHCSVCNAVITPQTATPKTPHTEVTDAGFPATCSAEGKTDGTHCSVCGTVVVPQTVIPKTPHTEVIDPQIPPTCTTAGKTEGKHCSVCNTVTTKPTDIPPTGHTPVADPEVPPTCTSTGKTAGAHCSVCGDVITPQAEIPAKGHSYTSVVTPPTTENAGYTTYTCTVCGDTYNDDYTPALGHNYVAGTVVPPTCTDRGYTVYTCTDCGDTYNGDYTPALGHDYKLVCNWAADYSSVTAKLVCTVCGDEKEIAADDIQVNDTSDADGNTVKTVTVTSDGKTYTESVTIPKPVDPSDPSNPGNPGDPSDPGNPGNPGDPSDPSNPGNPGDPSDPSNPSDPKKPVISVDMGEDGKLTGKDENGNDIDLDEYLDYKYYDKDGNEVTPDEFVDGGEYTAVATVKPDKEQEFKDRFANGDDMIEYLKDKTYTFVYHVHKTTGCDGKFDWLLFVCLAALALDVIMFILTMVIIKRRGKEEVIEDDDDNNNGDDYIEGGGRDNIIVVK